MTENATAKETEEMHTALSYKSARPYNLSYMMSMHLTQTLTRRLPA